LEVLVLAQGKSTSGFVLTPSSISHDEITETGEAFVV